MSDEYQGQGDFSATPYAASETYADTPAQVDNVGGYDQGTADSGGYDYSRIAEDLGNIGGLVSGNMSMAPDFRTLQQRLTEGGSKTAGSDTGMKDWLSDKLKPFVDDKGDLNKMGSLAFSAGASVLGELFSGSKRKAAALNKQMADAASARVANEESGRQNALTSTGAALAMRKDGLLNSLKYSPVKKPDWKI